MREQHRILQAHGSGADILAYSPNLDYPDHNFWMGTYLEDETGEFTGRPYFLAYEHVFGTRFREVDGHHDMDDPFNRKVFLEDVEWMVKEVMLRKRPGRYVTHRGKGVIYLWATHAMTGDFASLLHEARAKYPVAFLGSANYLVLSNDVQYRKNLAALDGFMDYGMVPERVNPGDTRVEYALMMAMQRQGARVMRQMIQGLESQSPRRYLFIPTFQAAYDDSKLAGRNNLTMYPRSRSDLLAAARAIREDMRAGIYNNLGPFIVVSELFEGTAVIPSQCRPDTADTPTRYVGYGLGRLQVIREAFAP